MKNIKNWFNKKEQEEYIQTKTIYPNRWILAKIFGIIAIVFFIVTILSVFIFPRVKIIETETRYKIIDPFHLLMTNLIVGIFLISLVIAGFNLVFATAFKKKRE